MGCGLYLKVLLYSSPRLGSTCLGYRPTSLRGCSKFLRQTTVSEDIHRMILSNNINSLRDSSIIHSRSLYRPTFLSAQATMDLEHSSRYDHDNHPFPPRLTARSHVISQ